MRSARGSNLKAIPTAPGTEPESDGSADLNLKDAMSVGAGVDDLENLPEAPKAMPIQAHDSPAQGHDDFDLNSLPDSGGTLGSVYNQISPVDPDHAAKVLDTSKRTGQDPAFVEANLKDAEKGANAPDQNFFKSIEDKFPGTTKFLQVPHNMAVAHDDIPNLAKHEQLVQGIKLARDLTDSLKAGWQGSVTGLTTRGGMPDTELPPDAPIQNRLAAQAAGLAGDFPTMVAGGATGAQAGLAAGVTAGAAVGLVSPPLAIPGAAVGGAVGGLVGAGAGAFAAPAAVKEALRLHYQNGNIKDVADALNRSGLILNEATKQGLVGGLTSAVGGAVAAPFESAAAKALLPSVFENTTLKTAVPLIAEDIAMTKAGNAVEGKETKPGDYLDTALLIGAMHGASHLGQMGIEHYVEAKKTAQAVQFYDGLGEAGGASKLLQRLPPQYQSMLGDLTHDSPVENIHIPQEAFNEYFQSKNIDPAQAADDLGVSEAYAEAQKTGGNVTIPTSDFVTKVVKTEHYQGLKDDIKFDPEGFTVNEIKAHQADIQEQMNQAQAHVESGVVAPEESALKLYDERYQQLIDAGRSETEAKAGATLHMQAFKALAERTGQDPYELAQKFQLEVKKREEMVPAEGHSFNQNLSPLGFYSPLASEVDKMDFKEMPPKDLANRIKNLPGIKGEELEHTGILDWLNGHEGKVTKAEVEEYLKNSGVEVHQVVKSENMGDSSGAADWSEPERLHDNDSDDINNEYEYYSSDDYWDEEATANLHNELAPDYTNENGEIDEDALSQAMDRAKDERASRMAQESVESDDYPHAQFVVEEQNTGEKLYGSDERGWYHSDLGSDLGDLEEAKVKLLSHLIASGDIEGNIAEHIHPEDIKWKPPRGEKPSEATLKKKANALFEKEKERFLKFGEEYNKGIYDKPGEESQHTREVLADAKRLAREEVEESYDKPENPKNKVIVNLNHALLEGQIKGNDTKGYSFELEGEDVSVAGDGSAKAGGIDVPLKAKTLEEAKAEVNQVLLDNKKITARPEVTPDNVNTPTGSTKWSRYKVPGGENYREVLLTLPNQAGEKFQYTTHFDEKNILAHVRLTDRVDAQGRKTLFIEEMQSDWHQQGRESGYKDKDTTEKLEALKQQRDALPDTENFKGYMNRYHFDVPQDEVTKMFQAGDSPEYKAWQDESDKILDEKTKLTDQIKQLQNGVPNAPFKNTDAWAGLALKRMIRMAVEQGYEAVAWTPAEVHVDRWGTDNVSWKKIADGEYRVGSVEQRGGRADGVDIEDLARRRGELLERKGSVVKTKEELKEVLLDTLNRERNDRSIDSLTDNVWKQMQEKAEGEKNPRAEGMQFFYDNVLPKKVASAVLKKLDPAAKVEVGKFDIGPDQSEYREAERSGDSSAIGAAVENKKLDAWEIPITDKMKEKALEGQTLFQGDQTSPRGRIAFQGNRAIIDLFKDANRSTFLHESGHYFLEVMSHMASEGSAPQSLKDDMQAIRDWMGLKEGEAIGTPQHEQFARGFEAYLMEGKAPSEALRSAFAKFKNWLVNLYQTAKGLNVELSPHIREVMDRMLATDKQIAEAEKTIGFAQNDLEVPENVKGRMDALADQARDQAEATLMREQMKETTAQHKEFLDFTRRRLTLEAEQQIRQMPVYRAIDDIKEAVGPKKSVEGMASKLLDGKLKDEDAVHFETAAEVYDFADGRELALNIINAKANDHFNEAVKEQVNLGMQAHADLMNTDKIRAAAMEAIHNEKMTELLALERNILSDRIHEASVDKDVSKRNQIEARLAAKAAKDQAKEILDQKPIKDAGNARIYVTAERNAAAKTAAAAARGEFEKAADYKRQQMLNHALASEAMRNREFSDKAVDYLGAAAKRGSDLRDMPYAFNRQVDQLLEKFGFKEKTPEDINTLRSIAKNMQDKGEDSLDIANATGQVIDPTTGQWKSESLNDFINRVNDNYVGLQLPDSILSGQGFADFKNMKMSDLRDLKDSVKLITDAGQKYDRFLNDFIKVDMKEAASQFKKSVSELIGAPYAENRKLGSKFDSEWKQRFENLKNLPDSVIPTLVNTLTLCHYLDGGEQGPAHEYIYRPMKQAEDRKFARYAKMREDLSGKQGLLGQFYTPQELADYKKEATKYDDRSITKENILAMALNWGNEANRDRIRAGFGLRDQTGRLVPMDDQAIEGLFKHLGKKDWDFAQATWKYLDTYWPEISALEMKMRGLEPKRVEAAPFTNEHGSYEGGYYPISYDFEKASEAFKNEQAKNELYKQYSASRAQTESGHAQARTSFVARPVRLSLDVLFNHLENVIHDLEFRPAVIDTSKFLATPDVKTTLENAIGMPAKRGLDTWLKSIASDQSENLTWIDKAMTWTRFGTTISALGLTPKAFLLHFPSNVLNSVKEIGAINTSSMLMRSALDVALARGELKDFVFDKSERMKQRLTVRDRDIMDMSKAWQGTAAGVIPHYAFMALHLADEMVSIPLWADVYKKNIAELGPRGATELADETITRTLGSGSKVDQINLQRKPGLTKLFTMFYSWQSVMFNRAWLDGKLAGLEYKQGNVGTAAAIMGRSTVYNFALPSIQVALLGALMHNGPTTDDERKKMMLGHMLSEPFSMIPVVRDIVPPIIHKTMGEQGGDYRMSPVETAYQNLYSPLADGARIAFTDGKHFDEHYAEEAARGMSQAAGYPQQLNTWAFNFWDYVQNNGEASMKDFLSRRRKK